MGPGRVQMRCYRAGGTLVASGGWHCFKKWCAVKLIKLWMAAVEESVVMLVRLVKSFWDVLQVCWV